MWETYPTISRKGHAPEIGADAAGKDAGQGVKSEYLTHCSEPQGNAFMAFRDEAMSTIPLSDLGE